MLPSFAQSQHLISILLHLTGDVGVNPGITIACNIMVTITFATPTFDQSSIDLVAESYIVKACPMTAHAFLAFETGPSKSLLVQCNTYQFIYSQ